MWVPARGGEVGPQAFSGTDFLRGGGAVLSSGCVKASGLQSWVTKLKATGMGMGRGLARGSPFTVTQQTCQGLETGQPGM